MAKKKPEISTDPNDLVRRAELRHRDWSSQSYKNARVEPIINDETYKYHICPVVDGQVKAHGGVPRDFHKFPREMFDPPSEMVIIAESEVADRVKEQEDKKARVSDLMRRGGPGGQLYPSLDQDGVGYCWAHSSTGAMMAVRAMNNNPYVPLSAFCVAATIKHGADQGGWCGESAQFARTKGICSQAIWPQGDRDYKKYDKPETWANADLHKSTEEWVDLTRDLYDVALTDAMIWTIALTASGAMAWDFNWWSHSVMGVDVCIVDGAICKRIRNSWGDSYGDKGFAVLQGSKAKVDSAICIRVAGAAGA